MWLISSPSLNVGKTFFRFEMHQETNEVRGLIFVRHKIYFLQPAIQIQIVPRVCPTPYTHHVACKASTLLYNTLYNIHKDHFHKWNINTAVVLCKQSRAVLRHYTANAAAFSSPAQNNDNIPHVVKSQVNTRVSLVQVWHMLKECASTKAFHLKCNPTLQQSAVRNEHRATIWPRSRRIAKFKKNNKKYQNVPPPMIIKLLCFCRYLSFSGNSPWLCSTVTDSSEERYIIALL